MKKILVRISINNKITFKPVIIIIFFFKKFIFYSARTHKKKNSVSKNNYNVTKYSLFAVPLNFLVKCILVSTKMAQLFLW